MPTTRGKVLESLIEESIGKIDYLLNKDLASLWISKVTDFTVSIHIFSNSGILSNDVYNHKILQEVDLDCIHFCKSGEEFSGIIKSTEKEWVNDERDYFKSRRVFKNTPSLLYHVDKTLYVLEEERL